MKPTELELLEAIQSVQARFIDNAPREDVLENLLSHLLELTGSACGFVGEIPAASDVAGSDASRSRCRPDVSRGQEFYDLDPFFDAARRTGQAVIANDPGGTGGGAGGGAEGGAEGGAGVVPVPRGDPPLRSFLGLTLHHREECVGVIGVANRPGGYSEELVTQLQPFTTTCSSILAAFRGAQERRLAQAALAESEQRFRQLAENLHEVFWLFTLPENDAIYVSPAYETVWGSSTDEVYANPQVWLEQIHPEDRPAVEASYARLADAVPFNEEYRLIRPDGSERWIHDRGFPILDDAGTASRVAGIAEDITARKRMEEILRKGEQRLRHSQRIEALGRVASGVAHDFNNFLTVINGNAEALLRVAGGERELRLLHQIRRAGLRAAGMTRQLLAFSRKQVLELRVLDIRDLFSDLAEFLPGLLGACVELVLDPAPAPHFVTADPHQLMQVAMNLAVNARDAMPDGGRLEIRSSVVSGGPRTDPDHIEITVTDSGVGIGQDVLPYIFDPFFTTKPDGEGSGLGLSTVYGIVTQLGGTVEVETGGCDGTEIQGTRFRIRLPATAAVPEPPVPVSPAGAGAGSGAGSGSGSGRSPPPRVSRSLTILLVDDEELVRQFAAMTLQDAGHVVFAAAGAEDACQLVADGDVEIDLLVTDVVLAGQSGCELAGRLRAENPDLPALFMSGYTADYATRIGVPDDRPGFLPKPFTADELLGMVDAVWTAARGEQGG